MPEVWRYNGERWQLLLVVGDHDGEGARSRSLAVVTPEARAALLDEGRALMDVAWMRLVRA